MILLLFFYKREIFTNINIRCPPNTLYESCPSEVLHKASSLTQEEEDEGTSVGAGTLVRVNLSEVRK